MVGHEDPKGVICKDKDGKLFVKVVSGSKQPNEPKVEKEFDSADVNKDGKVDVKDAIEVVKKFGRRKGNKIR